MQKSTATYGAQSLCRLLFGYFFSLIQLRKGKKRWP